MVISRLINVASVCFMGSGHNALELGYLLQLLRSVIIVVFTNRVINNDPD